MKKLENLNKDLFAEIEQNQLNDLSNIVGGNWVKYTLVNGQGDKEVRTGDQNGGGDPTDGCQDTYDTKNNVDMDYLQTSDSSDNNVSDFTLSASIDTPDAI